jgi:hypothetical protein
VILDLSQFDRGDAHGRMGMGPQYLGMGETDPGGMDGVGMILREVTWQLNGGAAYPFDPNRLRIQVALGSGTHQLTLAGHAASAGGDSRGESGGWRGMQWYLQSTNGTIVAGPFTHRDDGAYKTTVEFEIHTGHREAMQIHTPAEMRLGSLINDSFTNYQQQHEDQDGQESGQQHHQHHYQQQQQQHNREYAQHIQWVREQMQRMQRQKHHREKQWQQRWKRRRRRHRRQLRKSQRKNSLRRPRDHLGFPRVHFPLDTTQPHMRAATIHAGLDRFKIVIDWLQCLGLLGACFGTSVGWPARFASLLRNLHHIFNVDLVLLVASVPEIACSYTDDSNTNSGNTLGSGGGTSSMSSSMSSSGSVLDFEASFWPQMMLPLIMFVLAALACWRSIMLGPPVHVRLLREEEERRRRRRKVQAEKQQHQPLPNHGHPRSRGGTGAPNTFERHDHASAIRAGHVVVFVALLLYAGICSKAFRMYQCEQLIGPSLPTPSPLRAAPDLNLTTLGTKSTSTGTPTAGYGISEYLTADLGVQCWDGSHHRLERWAGFFVCLYAVGVPLALLLFLLRSRMQQRPDGNRRRYGNTHRRQADQNDDDDDSYDHLHATRFWYAIRERVFNSTIGGGSAVIEYTPDSEAGGDPDADLDGSSSPAANFVVESSTQQQSLSLSLYRPKWWYAEVCFLIQKLLLGGVFVLIEPHKPVQALCGTLLCVCFMAFVAHGRPFADELNNTLSTITNGHLTLTMALGLWVTAARATEAAGTAVSDSGGYDENTAAVVLLCAYAVVSVVVAVPLMCSVAPQVASKVLTFVWKHIKRSCGDSSLGSDQDAKRDRSNKDEDTASALEVEAWLWSGYAGGHAADYADARAAEEYDEEYDDSDEDDEPEGIFRGDEDSSSDSDASDDEGFEDRVDIDFGFGFDAAGPVLPPQRMLLDKYNGYNSSAPNGFSNGLAEGRTGGLAQGATKILSTLPPAALHPAALPPALPINAQKSIVSPPASSPPTSHPMPTSYPMPSSSHRMPTASHPMPTVQRVNPSASQRNVSNIHTPVTNAMMARKLRDRGGGSVASSIASANSSANDSPARGSGLGYRQRLLMQLSRGGGGGRAQRRQQQRQPPAVAPTAQVQANGEEAYEELLRLALEDGVLHPRENDQLAIARKKHSISMQQHSALFSRLMSEFEAGAGNDDAASDGGGNYYDDDADEGSYYEAPASPPSAFHPPLSAQPTARQQGGGRQVRFTLLPSPGPSPQQQEPVRFDSVEQRIRTSTAPPLASYVSV